MADLCVETKRKYTSTTHNHWQTEILFTTNFNLIKNSNEEKFCVTFTNSLIFSCCCDYCCVISRSVFAVSEYSIERIVF